MRWPAYLIVCSLMMAVILSMPQASAPLPIVPEETTYFFRGWESYPTGASNSLPDVDENTYLSLDWADTFAYVSNVIAHTGNNSLLVYDNDAGAGRDIVLHINMTMPAIAPQYVASLWFNRASSETTGYTGMRLAGNYSLNNNWDDIAIAITTGSNALGGCSANSICFYNTTSSAYEEADSLAYDTWYEISWLVYFVSGVPYVDTYLNDTLEQQQLPLFTTGLGLRGLLHAFVLSGSGEATYESQVYYDDLAVTGWLTDIPSEIYTVANATMTPSEDRIDFNDYRYIQESRNITQYAYDGIDGWTTVVDKVLDVGDPGYPDDEGVDQGIVYLSGGTYYLYYSMRDGDNPLDVIGLATSTDGENFTRYTGNGDGPTTRGVVFTNNPVSSRFDSWHTYDPSFVTYRGDRYWMIYTGTNVVDGGGARYLSGLAYSYNLTWWHRYPSNSSNVPFIDASWGDDCYADAQYQSVVWDTDASLYRALVRCKQSEPSTVRTLHQAYSSNLITWTMDDTTSDGRLFSEPVVHSGTTFLRDDLWYMLYERFYIVPQTDLRTGLAFSSDGEVWQNTKYVYLETQDIPGIATNGTNGIDTHLAYIQFLNETMRLWVPGASTDGNRYISIIERPINRFRYLELLPGATDGYIETQPLSVSAVGLTVNVINSAISNVTVEILDTDGDTLYSASDPVTSSGATVNVTWNGSQTISFTPPVKLRIRFASGAQLFDVGFAEAEDAIPVLPTWPVLEYATLFLFLSVMVFTLMGAWTLKKWRGGL